MIPSGHGWTDNLMPVIGDAYIKGEFPKQLDSGHGRTGASSGRTLPEEYGCAGLNNVAYGLIVRSWSGATAASARFASVQGGLVMYPIYAFGSEEQKKTGSPRLAAGQEIGCFGLTEPDFGIEPRWHDHHGA